MPRCVRAGRLASALICTRAGRTPPTPATGLGPPRTHLHGDRTPRRMVLVAAGSASDGRALHAGASAPARTFPAGTCPMPRSATGLGWPLPTATVRLGSPLPHLHLDTARPRPRPHQHCNSNANKTGCTPSHIRTETWLAPGACSTMTGLTPPTSSGTESARPSHICTGTGRGPADERMLSCADCAADG